MALAPNFSLVSVLSKRIIAKSISRCSNTLFSLISLAIVSFTLFIALNTLFPRYRASSLSRNSKASYFPVEAPLGTIALPENPLSVVTST